jgi:hypothetical protein
MADFDAHEALGRLQDGLNERGYETALVTPGEGRLPLLEVRNPEAKMLVERIVANANGYWWSWAEKIAMLDEVDSAAVIVARVLALP